jgi:N,N'-diacetyllegionaminate synthase
MSFGPDEVTVIAEAGDCKGDLGYALDAVDAAAATGVWGFKVQMFQADTLVRPGTPRYDRLRREGQPTTQYGLFSRSLPYREWEKVRERCAEQGMEFLATPFDLSAVHILDDWDVAAIKIASGDLTYERLVRAAADTGRRLIVSTGAAFEWEIRRALEGPLSGVVLALLACTLEYPALNTNAGLGRIGALQGLLRQRLAVGLHDVAGYSDHTVGSRTSAVAVGAGARVLEKHFTVTPGAGGDHDMGLSPGEMAEYVQWARWAMGLCAVSALRPMADEGAARAGARRALVTRYTVLRGERLKNKVDALRPWGTVRDPEEPHGDWDYGVEPSLVYEDWEAVVDIPAGTVVTHDMIRMPPA